MEFMFEMTGSAPTLVMLKIKMIRHHQMEHDLLFHRGMFAQDFTLDFKSHR